ncbi:hypothetical protein GCM10020220_075400 [Nonomuraea rubra]
MSLAPGVTETLLYASSGPLVSSSSWLETAWSATAAASEAGSAADVLACLAAPGGAAFAGDTTVAAVARPATAASKALRFTAVLLLSAVSLGRRALDGRAAARA